MTAHLSWESYKKKKLHLSAVIIYKLGALKMTAALPRSGQHSKISARKVIIQVKANQNITSRDTCACFHNKKKTQ